MLRRGCPAGNDRHLRRGCFFLIGNFSVLFVNKWMDLPDREYFLVSPERSVSIFPYGKMTATQTIGHALRQRRKALKLKQADLALVSGTGVRFISDLENGKDSCHLGKMIRVAESLGLEIRLQPRGGA